MSRQLLFKFVLLTALCCAWPLGLAEELELQVSVQPQTVREGEALRVTITAQGPAAGNAEIAGGAPKGKLLLPHGGFSSSRQVSWINGQKSAKTVFQAEYLATGTGPAQVPAFTVTAGGKDYKTAPVDVRILPRSAAGAAGAEDDRGLAIEARLDRESLFLGESLVLEYVLRSRVDIRDYSPKQLQQMADFLVEDVPIDPSSTARTVRDSQGREVREFVLFRRILSPTKTGRLTIPPQPFTFTVQSRDQRRRGFFFEPRVERVARYVGEQSVEVRALPEQGRPADFTGAVGQFTLDAQLAAENAIAGEAVNLVATVRGDGSLGMISPPLLTLPQDVQAYDPLEESIEQGARRWVFPLVPRAPGKVRLDGVHMSVFDPRTRSYRTLTAGPFELEVAPPRDGGAVASGSGSSRVRAQATDLRFIHSVPRKLVDRRGLSLASPWLWALGLLPLVGLPLVVAATLDSIATPVPRPANAPALRASRPRCCDRPCAANPRKSAKLPRTCCRRFIPGPNPCSASPLGRSNAPSCGER